MKQIMLEIFLIINVLPEKNKEFFQLKLCIKK